MPLNWGRRNNRDPSLQGIERTHRFRRANCRWLLFACLNFSLILAFSSTLNLTPPFAAEVTFPDRGDVAGDLQQYRIREKETLIEIARSFDLGFNEIVSANPGVDPFVPKAGTLITVPTAWILPAVSLRPAMVINLAEFRLYYLPNSPSGQVLTFPLGIGDQGRDTPTGSYTVVEKMVSPA